MLRTLYISLLRLHPAAFRERFGREMLEVFDHTAGWSFSVELIADALLSLLRQWTLRPEFRQPSLSSPVSLFRTIPPYQPRLTTMLPGGFVAIASFAAVIGAASHSSHPLGLSIRIPSVSAGLFADETPRPAFAAFLIKRNASGDPRALGIEFLPGGRFRATNVPLLPVLSIAYGARFEGVPDWIYTDRYDIEATSADRTSAKTSKAQIDEIRLMLRSAFEDRLKLTVNSVSVEKPVYALTVGPRGPNLEKMKTPEKYCDEAPSIVTGCHQFQGGAGRGIRGAAVDMSDLALYISNWSDAPVIDQTGLPGLYSIETEGWAAPFGSDQSRSNLFEICARLGLKLVRTKAHVEMFRIEHIERPSQN